MAAADDDNDTDHAHVHLPAWPACSGHVYAFICRLVTGNPCYIGVGRESLSCVLSRSICNVRHRRETYRVAFYARVQAKYDTFIEKHTHTHQSSQSTRPSSHCCRRDARLPALSVYSAHLRNALNYIRCCRRDQ